MIQTLIDYSQLMTNHSFSEVKKSIKVKKLSKKIKVSQIAIPQVNFEDHEDHLKVRLGLLEYASPKRNASSSHKKSH